MSETHPPTLDTVSLDRDGHVLVIGLNRPEKRNAFTLAMLADLSRAYALLESDETLRAGVLLAHGEHFTAGLDLVDVGPSIVNGVAPFPDDGRDPWRLDGEWTSRSSPQHTADASLWVSNCFWPPTSELPPLARRDSRR